MQLWRTGKGGGGCQGGRVGEVGEVWRGGGVEGGGGVFVAGIGVYGERDA